ncbi:MAG: VWA domain-containing protein [Nitrospirales bacterium]|nr:VWA domain-containing protein [Nitrospirales bacterium]
MILSIPQKHNSQLHNQRGSYLMISVIVLMVLFGFAGLGVEVGRWYAVQGEMSKSIDGAAFAGAKNVNNPNIPDLNAFVLEVAQANFEAGLLGTDTPVFTVTNDGNGKITVDGSAHALNTLIKGFNPAYDKTQVSTSGSAKLRNAEIALVLDISGSMGGSPINDLKDGAKQFVQNFSDHQSTSKFALLTFANGVIKNYNMDHNFVSPIETAINGLNALGGTNSEEAFTQALALPWVDQSGLPPNEKGKQVVVFFSDGNPTAFRGDFQRNGTWYDAAVPDGSLMLSYPNQQYDQISSYVAYPSGNGTGQSGSGGNQCGSGTSYKRVRWAIFTDSNYGLNSGVYPPFNGYSSTYCFTNSQLAPYVTAVARQMAIDNAQLIKDQGIDIYTIGLGNVDPALLQTLSSGPDFAYYTTDSSELAGIFQQIANILKLVLVS